MVTYFIVSLGTHFLISAVIIASGNTFPGFGIVSGFTGAALGILAVYVKGEL